jgi:uncharacterized protein YkwD
MKTLLVSLALVAVGAWQLNEHPFVLTLTPIEETTHAPQTEAPSNPVATTTTAHPATTTKPTPTPRPTPGATTPSTTPTPPAPAGTPATTPGTASPQEEAPTTQSYAAQIEELVLQKTNTERAKNDLGGLSANATLTNIARAHSADMQAHDYFAHEDSTGCDSSCRADAVGYQWMAIGENIYMMEGFSLSADATADKIVQGWMNSPGHRANILNGTYIETGVGVSVVGETIYITANYSKPR